MSDSERAAETSRDAAVKMNHEYNGGDHSGDVRPGPDGDNGPAKAGGNDERARILQMVAEGKVTPTEAEDLLDAVSPQPSAEWKGYFAGGAPAAGWGTPQHASANFPPAPPPPPGAAGASFAYLSSARPGPDTVLRSPLSGKRLIIRIEEEDGGEMKQKVNVAIPLNLALAASKLIPSQAREHLENMDINLKDLLESLAGGESEGMLVDIREDDTRIHIYTE